MNKYIVTLVSGEVQKVKSEPYSVNPSEGTMVFPQGETSVTFKFSELLTILDDDSVEEVPSEKPQEVVEVKSRKKKEVSDE